MKSQMACLHKPLDERMIEYGLKITNYQFCLWEVEYIILLFHVDEV